ncbi:MAG: hypothetical protein ACYC7E_23360 [Armatimonadota bacterium]
MTDVHNPTAAIDFNATTDEELCCSEDLRPYYASGAPGVDCLQSRRVILTASAKRHIKDDHDPCRLQWILAHIAYLQQALNQPEIIYTALDFKSDARRWAQVFAVEVPGIDRFMAVVVSLARANAGDEGIHHVITVIDAGQRYFYKRQGQARGALKEKWKQIR